MINCINFKDFSFDISPEIKILKRFIKESNEINYFCDCILKPIIEKNIDHNFFISWFLTFIIISNEFLENHNFLASLNKIISDFRIFKFFYEKTKESYSVKKIFF